MEMVTVKIGNIDWNVYPVKHGDVRLMAEDDENVLGITYFSESTIYICNDCVSASVMKRTILHELCHAALFSYGYDAEHMNEEDICNFFELAAPELCAKSDEVYNALTNADVEDENASPLERPHVLSAAEHFCANPHFCPLAQAKKRKSAEFCGFETCESAEALGLENLALC